MTLSKAANHCSHWLTKDQSQKRDGNKVGSNNRHTLVLSTVCSWGIRKTTTQILAFTDVGT